MGGGTTRGWWDWLLHLRHRPRCVLRFFHTTMPFGEVDFCAASVYQGLPRVFIARWGSPGVRLIIHLGTYTHVPHLGVLRWLGVLAAICKFALLKISMGC